MADDFESYSLGGYCRLRSGDKLKHARYEVTRKLGYGAYSIVHLARDEECDKAIAIKVVKSATSFAAAAENEVDILETLGDRAHAHAHEGAKHVAELLDAFQHPSRYFGHQHPCLVFPAYGQSLEVVKQQRPDGLPIAQVRSLARQLLLALDFLAQTGIVHTDLKLDNILLRPTSIVGPIPSSPGISTPARNASCSPPTTSRPLMVPLMFSAVNDSGIEAYADDHQVDPKFETVLIDFEPAQTLILRAPEVVLGCIWDAKIDVWSAACRVFEMAAGVPLMACDPATKSGKIMSGEELLLGLALGHLGLKHCPPLTFATAHRRAEFFDDEGHLRDSDGFETATLDDRLSASPLAASGAYELARFLTTLLALDPADRADAATALQDPFLKT